MKLSFGSLAVGILVGALFGSVRSQAEGMRYSYACWLNGWRKQAGDKSPEILAIQASGYDFTLNLTDFGKAGYAVNGRAPVGYAEALETGTGHFDALPQAELVVEVEVDGKKYRAVACEAGKDPDPRRLGEAEVRTLRTDDYARTWNRLRYDLRTAAKSEGVWFFKMGKTNEYVTPRIAYGNVAGLIEERKVPGSLKPGQGLVDRVTLAGDGPWWVAFPGARHTNQRDWGTGSRALLIRSYRAKLGGKEYTRPTISMPVHWSVAEGVGLDLLLVAPPEVSGFQPGDEVELEAQWITLPRTAEDYYGPNEAFRKHLAENPMSWKSVYREAKGNDLAVTARGGKVLHRYPVIVKAEGPEVEQLAAGE